MDGDIPLETREHRKPPDPFARNLNNDTARAVTADVRMDGEYIPGMVKESTVWDVYNNEARKVDNELVKDWTASLNFLLVFVSPLLYATILLLILIGGHLCGRTHRIYHREQEDAGTGPDGSPRRHYNPIFQ
jgi:Family of unknown function (DUF6535)